MTAYPLPAPAAVVVGQTGGSALWNAGFGPAVNFLANRPYAILRQATAQSLPTAASNRIAFDTGFDNTGIAHSTTVNNSRYTCPLPGIYHVTAQVGLQPPTSGGSFPYAGVSLIRNGDTAQMWGAVKLYFDTSGTRMGGTVQLTAALTLKAGDYIEVACASQAAVAVSTWTNYRAPQMFVHWAST